MIVMEMKIGNSVLKIDDDAGPDCEDERKQRMDAVVKLITQNYIHKERKNGDQLDCYKDNFNSRG